MSIFAHKPGYIDFGSQRSVQTVKFVHQAASITIVDKPSWVGDIVLDYVPYTTGDSLAGTMKVHMNNDVASSKQDGAIHLLCDTTDIFIHCVFSYDSINTPVMDVVDNALLMIPGANAMSGDSRIRAMLIAKRWLQDNRGASGTNVKMGEVVVENGIAYPPEDFVRHLNVYAASEDGFLLPIYNSENINTASSPLKDGNGYYILDDNDHVVVVSGLTPRVDDTKSYSYYGLNIPLLTGSIGVQYQVKEGEISANGLYTFDKETNTFLLHGVKGNIVIEYISDPVLRHSLTIDYGELMVHKTWQEPLEEYIYYKMVDKDRNISYSEKQRALRSYSLAYKRASIKGIDINHLRQELRGYK